MWYGRGRGEGQITIDEPIALDGTTPGDEGATYEGRAFLLDARNQQASFGFRGRSMVGTPVGGRLVDVFMVAVVEDGTEPQLLPTTRRGILSTPTLDRGVYSVRIAPRTYRAPARKWSHEEQERLHPGDTIFSQMRALAKGINGIHFPHVPNYRSDGDYGAARVIQKPSGEGGRGAVDDRPPGTLNVRNPGVIFPGGGASAVRLRRARSGVPKGV